MIPTRTKLLITALLLTLSTAMLLEGHRGTDAAIEATSAPEFTSSDPADWINGPSKRCWRSPTGSDEATTHANTGDPDATAAPRLARGDLGEADT